MTIDALVDAYCDRLSTDGPAMEALGLQRNEALVTIKGDDRTVPHAMTSGKKLDIDMGAQAFVNSNVERMSHKVDKFCKDHKHDKDEYFQQSMESMVKTTADHFAETSKAAMSRGRDVKHYPVPPVFDQIETSSHHQSAISYTTRKTIDTQKHTGPYN